MNSSIDQLLGSYRLDRFLGEGGFAEVYLGEHIYLKTIAAVKILRTRLQATSLEQFLQEARTIAHMEHPHIVRVLDFGIKRDMPYLVMQYAPGGTVRQRYPFGSRLPTKLLLSYVGHIASALQYAHDLKLIHRDVKPENILLSSKNEALLSDFGLAIGSRSTFTSSTTHKSGGTIQYMAPEQLQGKPSRASDQYALGMIVYEWLSGSTPFSGTPLEVAMQHLFGDPAPLRVQIPDLPESIEQVVMRALAKHPSERFPSVQEFATALTAACTASDYLSYPGKISDTAALEALPEIAISKAESSIYEPSERLDVLDSTNLRESMAAMYTRYALNDENVDSLKGQTARSPQSHDAEQDVIVDLLENGKEKDGMQERSTSHTSLPLEISQKLLEHTNQQQSSVGSSPSLATSPIETGSAKSTPVPVSINNVATSQVDRRNRRYVLLAGLCGIFLLLACLVWYVPQITRSPQTKSTASSSRFSTGKGPGSIGSSNQPVTSGTQKGSASDLRTTDNPVRSTGNTSSTANTTTPTTTSTSTRQDSNTNPTNNNGNNGSSGLPGSQGQGQAPTSTATSNPNPASTPTPTPASNPPPTSTATLTAAINSSTVPAQVSKGDRLNIVVHTNRPSISVELDLAYDGSATSNGSPQSLGTGTTDANGNVTIFWHVTGKYNAGPAHLTASATDTNGNTVTSSPVSITITSK